MRLNLQKRPYYCSDPFNFKKKASIHLLLKIPDTGKGISAKQHAESFQDFIQADASISYCHSRTSLGIAITRKLI